MRPSDGGAEVAGSLSANTADVTLPDNLVSELTALTGVILEQENLPATLVEICRIAVRALPSADGASITTLSKGRPGALADTEWAQGFDELQFEEHEGPCFDA